jgi:hypothetical protein
MSKRVEHREDEMPMDGDALNYSTERQSGIESARMKRNTRRKSRVKYNVGEMVRYLFSIV